MLPEQLEGIKILWSVLGVCDTGNSGLFVMVQKTLINIYSNLSSELTSQAQSISDSFVQECLACLQHLRNDFEKKTEKEKRESFKCISQMLTSFFETTEVNGLGNMHLHKQLEEAPFLTKITVESKLPKRRGVDANYLEINTSSSMTVWEFKVLVAKYTN